MKTPFILTLSCDDRPGIVANVTGLLFENGANILEAQQFDDVETGRFFMRVVFDLEKAEDGEKLSKSRGSLGLSALREAGHTARDIKARLGFSD